ncbi:hypothetical protein IAU60_000033 [Kwoniella sp. DSM 27419]
MTIDYSPSPVKLDQSGPYLPLAGQTEYRLTPWREDDVDYAVALFNHPAIGKYSCLRPYPYLPKNYDFYLPYLTQLNDFGETLATSRTPPPPSELTKCPVSPLSALREVSIGRVVGQISFFPSPRTDGWELAYDVHPDLQGRGLARAMIGAISDLMRYVGIKRVIAFCETTNAPSAGLLRKAGFTQFMTKMQAWPEEKGGGERETIGFAKDL